MRLLYLFIKLSVNSYFYKFLATTVDWHASVFFTSFAQWFCHPPCIFLGLFPDDRFIAISSASCCCLWLLTILAYDDACCFVEHFPVCPQYELCERSAVVYCHCCYQGNCDWLIDWFVDCLQSMRSGFRYAVKYVLPRMLLGPVFHFLHYCDTLKVCMFFILKSETKYKTRVIILKIIRRSRKCSIS